MIYSRRKRAAGVVGREPTPSTTFSQYKALECRNFWRAGSYGIYASTNAVDEQRGSLDFRGARVHPRFLHSNATSHKWAFSAIAELLDNAVDEIRNGATFVKVDRLFNRRDNSPALLFQDDGGGMDPLAIRRCLSLGFSSKNSSSEAIGRYGNGLKTSTMRLGADAIVLSCSVRRGRSTRSVGLLSYTYLVKTMKDDIVVPVIDFEVVAEKAVPLVHGSEDDWNSNLKAICEWSLFSSLDELATQFDDIGCHGTKVIVYNLWHDDDDKLELDFDDDGEDIRLRQHDKDADLSEEHIELARSHISCTFRYSLRAYASILYLRTFTSFSIILRGKPVEQLKIVSQLKFPKMVVYRPFVGKDLDVKMTVGFAKEAPVLPGLHGFNIYHRNRLITPFWQVFQEGSNRGKCVVGVLEANFIEPAHNKQDFEQSPLFNRLEMKLKRVVAEYWKNHCSLIGYKPKNMENQEAQEQTIQAAGLPQSSDVQQATSSREAVMDLSPPLQLKFHVERPQDVQKGASPRPTKKHTPRSRDNNPPSRPSSVGVFDAQQHEECAPPCVDDEESMLDNMIKEATEYPDRLDPDLFDRIAEENVRLFAKREQSRQRQEELKHENEKLEEELQDIRMKCAKLVEDLELRKRAGAVKI